tara:strand:+ start:266 stop:439 length:174 start_codon:yes stop_codon:yes gene_type:complete
MIDCLLYQRYGGDHDGVPDLNDVQNDTTGIGFPLLPIFFPVEKTRERGGAKIEVYPI